MLKRMSVLLAVAALVMGASLFAAPSTSHAIIITSISVDVGGVIYCGNATGAGCIWTLGPAGVDLDNGGKNLVLAQTAAFNFDSSDRVGGAFCIAPTPCATTLSINGGPVTAVANTTLANFNLDTGGTVHNEAAGWSFALSTGPGGVTVNFGYADDAHTGPCLDDGGTVATPGNCHPDGPWLPSSPTTTFLGGPFGTSTTGCAGTVAPCFDSGAIWIVANPRVVTPEPSTLFLIGAGLMGLAAWGRKRTHGTDRV